MALIIEDGSNVADADSFLDLAEVRAYVSKRGDSVSQDDATLEQHLILATDYIVGREAEFQGVRTYSDQSLTFPRKGVCVNDLPVGETVIPNLLKNAICELCVIQQAGIPLYSTQSSLEFGLGPVIEEGVGPLKVKYSDKHVEDLVGSPESRREAIFSKVETHLIPLLGEEYNTLIGGLKSLRV